MTPQPTVVLSDPLGHTVAMPFDHADRVIRNHGQNERTNSF